MSSGLWWGILFVAGAAVISVLPGLVWRRRPEAREDTRRLALDVIMRIGVLHGVILAMVFSDAQRGAQTMHEGISSEAQALIHIYFNAQRYGDATLGPAVENYTQRVIDNDWTTHRAHRRVSDEGWLAWREMLDRSLALAPNGRAQELLAERIQTDVWRVAEFREARGVDSGRGLPTEFWIISISGLALIAMLLYVHPTRPVHLVIMAAYSAYTGLVLFLIWDVSHPWAGAITAGAGAFDQVLATIRHGI